KRVEILDCSLAVSNALEDLGSPGGSLAALRALAAALVREEAGEARDHGHHRLRVVNHDHAAGAEHRPTCYESLVIHERCFGFLHVLDRNRCTARNHRLELAAVEWTAAEIVQEFLEWEAHHDLVRSGALHVAAY